MKFEAKNISITLEVSANGEDKIFIPRDRVSGQFASKVLVEMDVYIEAQKALPESEQDKMYMGNLKFLNMIYKDLDTEWLLNNFNYSEISEMKTWAFQGLVGVKKDEEN
jgi:hypothetical protein